MSEVADRKLTRSPILDDRGQPVRAKAAGWGPARKHSDELTRARAREIERSFSRSGAPVKRVTAIATLLAMPFFLLPALAVPFLVPVMMRHGIAMWTIPLGAALGILGPLVMMLVLRRLMLPRLVRAYVADGFCGSCGFTIRDLQPEEDACRVCPECGSAWRLEQPA